MDSFRLVRYEMSTGKHSCGMENILLQQRHNAAPGMVLVSKPTAGLAKGCRLCSVLIFMAPTGWQQQCLPEAEQVTACGRDGVRRTVVRHCPFSEIQTFIIKVL